jgi:hypothetical protein
MTPRTTGPGSAARIALVAAETEEAQEALERLGTRYATVPFEEAEVIVALGGDGLMLETLHASIERCPPIYGMNRGTVGFLMNEFAEDDLPARLARAEQVTLHPLRMKTRAADGTETEALAINEVSLLREGRQSAHIRISVDGEVQLEELIGDGALVATPAGSSAYNFSGRGAGAACCCPTRPRSPSRCSTPPSGRSRPRPTTPRCTRWCGSRFARPRASRCTCCSTRSTTSNGACCASSSCRDPKKRCLTPTSL